jgi:RES domain-containing protein
VSISVWRIATDTKDYEADDLSGKGAEITGGRWNDKGTPLVYTSTNRALAALETIVHLNSGGLPLNRYLVEIVIKDDVWNVAEALDQTTAPVGWTPNRRAAHHRTMAPAGPELQPACCSASPP